MLAADPALREELRALVEALPAPTAEQRMAIQGSQNVGVQAAGSRINVNVGGRPERSRRRVEHRGQQGGPPQPRDEGAALAGQCSTDTGPKSGDGYFQARIRQAHGRQARRADPVAPPDEIRDDG